MQTLPPVKLLVSNFLHDHGPTIIICESVNHVLKQAIDWKAQPLTDLVNTLHEVVKAQYRELERCLFGVGEFQLCQEFRHFSMPVTTWSQSTYNKRQRHFSRFLRTIKPIKAKVVASSDGTRHVLAPVSGGKKPGQTKRKRTAKTTTVKRGKRTNFD